MKIKKLLFFFIFGIIVGAVGISLFNQIAQPDIQILTDREYFNAVYNEIHNAKHSIHIIMFSLTYYQNFPESKVNQLLEELVYAKSRGVDVKVIVDEFPENQEEGVEFLKKFGIPVKYDGLNQTTHAKLIIIDGEKVIIGSSNWRYYSLEKNHEANVLIRSPKIAKQFEEYFKKIWKTLKT